jgi:preprotein translocase subunit YajC
VEPSRAGHRRRAADGKVITVFFAAESQGGGSSYSLLIMMAILFGGMYFLMIRPQQKRRREIESMQSSIGPGDEIVTVGGLYGTVVEIDDEAVTLEVAPGVSNRYARGAIARVVNRAARPDDPTTDSKVIESD